MMHRTGYKTSNYLSLTTHNQLSRQSDDMSKTQFNYTQESQHGKGVQKGDETQSSVLRPGENSTL